MRPNKRMQSFDYIISGVGCAGLSLALRLIESGNFSDKKILLVDLSFNKSNDRTWCFWEKETGLFEPVVNWHWEKLWFYSDGFSTLKDIFPYRYKMIRGQDFYTYCLEIIRRQTNIQIREARVQYIHSDEKESYVMVNGEKIYAQYIFNSILFEKPLLNKKDHYLLQHFKGWVVESRNKIFNPEEAVLMDFRVSQQLGTAFVYIMPFSKTRALVEFTLFTKKLLKDPEYDELLRAYLKNIPGIDGYEILEEEFGVIPMTSHHFPARQHHIFNIGIAGGQTRASTGYTFQFIQKQTAEMVKQLIMKREPRVNSSPGRFRFYDRLFLDVLARSKKDSPYIFAYLFGFNPVKDIFDFLDAKSNLLQDFMVISSLPKRPFIRAALREMFKVTPA
jgi:lycopene beta-cyclase